jgi:hypothetical protein
MAKKVEDEAGPAACGTGDQLEVRSFDPEKRGPRVRVEACHFLVVHNQLWGWAEGGAASAGSLSWQEDSDCAFLAITQAPGTRDCCFIGTKSFSSRIRWVY